MRKKRTCKSITFYDEDKTLWTIVEYAKHLNKSHGFVRDRWYKLGRPSNVKRSDFDPKQNGGQNLAEIIAILSNGESVTTTIAGVTALLAEKENFDITVANCYKRWVELKRPLQVRLSQLINVVGSRGKPKSKKDQNLSHIVAGDLANLRKTRNAAECERILMGISSPGSWEKENLGSAGDNGYSNEKRDNFSGTSDGWPVYNGG